MNRSPLSAPRARVLEREWLDDLPAHDPRAIRSRRDLRLMNRVMGNAGIIERALREHVTSTHPRIVELGAGDGSLMLRIARTIGWRKADIVFVDQAPVVSESTIAAFTDLGWGMTVAAADVFSWLRDAPRF